MSDKRKEKWSVGNITLGERQICELLAVTNVFHGSEWGLLLEKMHGATVRITVERQPHPSSGRGSDTP